MGEFKAPAAQQNKTATPAQAPKEVSSLGETEFIDSRASTFQFIQLQAAADDQGKRNRITQLQSKAALLTSSSRIAQLQAKSDSRISSTQSPIVQREENKTGLPDNLKSGMESISGLSLSDVKVHRNSDKPAQLQAHAYAQGTDIHLGPGQEKHLPHELGHVVQQKEGRVKPTAQLKDKVNINDDSGLEKEADVLGAKAKNIGSTDGMPAQLKSSSTTSSEVTQLAPKWINKLKGMLKGKGGYDKLNNEGPEEEGTDDTPEVGSPEQEGVPISAGPFSYQDGEVTMEVWPGQEIKFGKGGVSGDLPSKEFKMDIGGLEAGIDVPFAPGAYATVSLAISPKMSVSVSGGTFEIGDKSLSIQNANITGTMSLDITAKAGAGVGVANVAGLAAGAFATLGGESSLGGSMAGTVNFDAKTYNVNLNLNAAADIVGNAGVFVEAKALGFTKSKKWVLANKQFAHFNYLRGLALTGKKGDWTPRVTDFQKIEYGDHSSQNFLETNEGLIYSKDPEYNIKDTLLEKGERSED